MRTPPVSTVLISTYNHGRYVTRAVESVLKQDYAGAVECIVVDDGSTDETVRLLEPYREHIRYIRQVNAGQNAVHE